MWWDASQHWLVGTCAPFSARLALRLPFYTSMRVHRRAGLFSICSIRPGKASLHSVLGATRFRGKATGGEHHLPSPPVGSRLVTAFMSASYRFYPRENNCSTQRSHEIVCSARVDTSASKLRRVLIQLYHDRSPTASKDSRRSVRNTFGAAPPHLHSFCPRACGGSFDIFDTPTARTVLYLERLCVQL